MDGKCKIVDKEFFRTTPNPQNAVFLIESKYLADNPLTDEEVQAIEDSWQPATNNDNTDSTGDTNNANGDIGRNIPSNAEFHYADLPPELSGDGDDSISWDDIPKVGPNTPAGSLDDIEPALLDKTARLQYY